MGLDIIYGNYSFRAGSYSGFHSWRVQLAKLICLDESTMFLGRKTPFEPLLNHSDCDGTIGKVACKSLQKDFHRFMFAAMEAMNTFDVDVENSLWWFERYLKWKQAVDTVVKGEANKIEFC